MYFVKDRCEIEDKGSDEILVKGLRTSDSCYVIEPNKHELDACLMSQKDKTNFWHQRLGHNNFRDLSRLNRNGIVKGLPILIHVDNIMCKDCQKEQTNLV